MPTNYTGNASATQAPAPTPGPGAVPVVTIPADGDADNAASIAQALKYAADYLAYIFTGILKVFFPTPPTTSTDAAQAYVKDANGNVRGLVDHLGYFGGGHVSYLDEVWDYTFSASSTATPLANNPRWAVVIASPGTIASSNPTTTYDSPFVTIAPLTGANQVLETAMPLVYYPTTSLSFMAEADVGTNLSGSFYFGLLSNGVTLFGGNPSARFRATGIGNNWQCETCNGTTTTTVDSGVAASPTSDPSGARLRIELHGSGSPYGSKARFFINGAKVAEITATLPPASPYLLAFQVTSNNNGYVGAVHCAWNRFLNPEAV